jgi:hypothetical protein
MMLRIDLVTFLASDGADYITGQSIITDGGIVYRQVSYKSEDFFESLRNYCRRAVGCTSQSLRTGGKECEAN